MPTAGEAAAGDATMISERKPAAGDEKLPEGGPGARKTPPPSPPPSRRSAEHNARSGGKNGAENGEGPHASTDHGTIGRILEEEVGLTADQAAAFIAVTTGGRMTAPQIARAAGIAQDAAGAAAESLIAAGAFIDMPGASYEAMHPRFTAVNMYRRACERSGRPFSRNNAVDAVGSALEGAYDAARTGGQESGPRS